MQIKIQCDCGAKYSFEIEPVNGQMPVTVNCPKCGADGTPAANQIIQEQLATTAAPEPAPAPAEAPKARLRVAGGHATAPAQAAPAAAVPSAEGQVTVCNRHTRNPAAAECFICHKPICTECMSMFGYLCSVQCRYQAEQQKIKVPVYEFQKSRVEAKSWQKVGRITAAVVFGILCLFVLYLWYYIVGSRPAEFYSVKWRQSDEPVHTRFLDKSKMLLVRKDQVQVHDLNAKKQLWSAPLGDTAEKKEDDDWFSLGRREVHVAGDTIWIYANKQLLAFDQATGAEKHKIAIDGSLGNFSASDDALMLVSSLKENRKLLTRIDLPAGTAKTQELTVTPTRTELVTEELPDGVPATSAFMLDRELDEFSGKRPLKTVFSQFVFGGNSVVEMQVRLVQENVSLVQAMKAPPKTSSINENTSAASDVRAVAEELMNDLKRSRTGGVKRVDESRYGVTLVRHMTEGGETWSDEVVGPPALFPQKTVDVLVAGKAVYLFDKKGKKLAQSKLTYPIADWLVSKFGGMTPCLEENGMLYFYDQGFLAAFELPSGNVLWRLPSVGISNIASDHRGNLYVNTTTASPESIQYSEDINLRDPSKAVLLKVNAKTGKPLWQADRAGIYCQVSGKYLYAVNSQSGGMGFAVGLSEALNSPFERAEHFRIYRIKPSNGSQVWEYYQQGSPVDFDFAENRIILQERGQVKVMKYLSF